MKKKELFEKIERIEELLWGKAIADFDTPYSMVTGIPRWTQSNGLKDKIEKLECNIRTFTIPTTIEEILYGAQDICEIRAEINLISSTLYSVKERLTKIEQAICKHPNKKTKTTCPDCGLSWKN